jgi:hypothetical protein
MKNVLFSATALLFSLLLNGCAFSLPFSVTDPRTGKEYTVPSRLASVPGIHELAEACAERSGRVVHKVAYVDGYFDANWRSCDQACWRYLSDSDFQYIEIEVSQVEKWLFLKELGYWRISKAPKDDPSCAPKPSHYIAQRAVTDKKGLDHCLVFEKLEEPKSRYHFRSWIEKTNIDNEGESELVEEFYEVTDVLDKKTTASQLDFSLYTNHVTDPAGFSLHCGLLGIETFSGRFRENAIKAK